MEGDLQGPIKLYFNGLTFVNNNNNGFISDKRPMYSINSPKMCRHK